MAILSTKNTVLIVGGVVAAVVVYYAGRAAIQKISEAGAAVGGAVVDAVNPIKIVQNAGATVADIYTGLGENNTSLGADIGMFWELPERPTNEQIKQLPMGAGVSMDLYQWLTGSKGNQISDFNEWWDGVWR